MKNTLKKFLLLSFITVFAFSCSDDSEIVTDPTDNDFDVELSFSEGGGDVVKTKLVTASTGVLKARVQISSTSNMKRVYITRSVNGEGFEPYEFEDLSREATKADGSLDVETTPKNIDYTLYLNVPTNITEGNVVYRFWATSGRGDYRDSTKRLVAGVGEIVLDYGGSNPNAEVNMYTAKIFAAPLANGSSESFISLLDGKLYRIDQGEEFVSFWDFGYYFGATNKASLASTSDYPSSIVDIKSLTGISDSAEFNKIYFLKSTTFDVTQFNSITLSGELDGIVKSSSEVVTNLLIGDIVEFVDKYGKKGLIKVVDKVDGYGTGAFIEIDIKVQP